MLRPACSLQCLLCDCSGKKASTDLIKRTCVQCGVSGAVSYTYENTTQLTLKIPLEAASNHREVQEYKAREQRRSDLAATDAEAYIGAGVRYSHLNFCHRCMAAVSCGRAQRGLTG